MEREVDDNFIPERYPRGANGAILFHLDFCEYLIRHMCEGRSYEAFAAMLRVSRETLYAWEKRYPEWKAAKAIAKEGNMRWWEEVAMNTAAGVIKGNASMIQFMLRNRDSERYKDKQQVEHTGQVNFIVDTGIKRIGDPGYQDWIEGEVTVPPKLTEHLSNED